MQAMTGTKQIEARILAQMAAELNARPWSEVRANYAGQPTNDEVSTSAPEGVVEDDGTGIQEEHPHAESTAEAAAGAETPKKDPVLDALRDLTSRVDKIVGSGSGSSAPPAAETVAQQQAAATAAGEAGELSDAELEALIDKVPFTDANFDDDGYLTPAGNMALMRLIARDAAREEISPDRQSRDEERRDAEAAELEEKYPALQDGDFADQMIAATVERAQRAGRPELALEPGYLEETYLIHVAREKAGSETPAGQQTSGVVLETGGSAAPARTRTKADDGDRIVALAKKAHYRLGDK